MQHNLNIKSSSNPLKIVIKLSKINDNYTYITDTLIESSRIKIPITPLPSKDKPQIPKKNGVQVKMIQDTEIEYEPELEPEVKEAVDKLAQAKNQQVIIPSCSQWFSIDDIHEIEMNSLPEFFCGKYPSKTPQNYKEYRNFIISLYRENPSTYLSSTSKYILYKIYLIN